MCILLNAELQTFVLQPGDLKPVTLYLSFQLMVSSLSEALEQMCEFVIIMRVNAV